jgi:hypothetical protein
MLVQHGDPPALLIRYDAAYLAFHFDRKDPSDAVWHHDPPHEIGRAHTESVLDVGELVLADVVSYDPSPAKTADGRSDLRLDDVLEFTRHRRRRHCDINAATALPRVITQRPEE